MQHVRFRDTDCAVVTSHYGNGRIALQLIDAASGEPVGKATVNLPEVPVGPNEVFIKDYAENDGMLAALVQAGVVRPSGQCVPSGDVQVHRVTLLPPLQDRAYGSSFAEIRRGTRGGHDSHGQGASRGR